MNRLNFILSVLTLLHFPFALCHGALVDGKLGTITSSATLKVAYDSKVFAMPSSSFSKIKSTLNSNSEIESEDDFIISFSPSLHFASKLGLLKLSGSAGVNIVQYLINDKKSYLVPTTSLTLDFDDTLALKKRLSNNAKIRFESTFDVGQVIGASVLEQDLVAYSYINSGLNVRYNHSDKFAVGGGTSYSYRFYQTDKNSRTDQPNFDFSTLPISARAFYIYSEKLDFFTNYTFSRTRADSSGSELTSSNSHSISIGADGQFSSKLSGTASIGYSLVDFVNPSTPNQDNIITSLSVSLKHNSKTASSFSLSRSFSPTSMGDSTFTTSLGYGLSHRFTEDWSGSAKLSAGFTEFTNTTEENSHDMNSYGFGFSTAKILSRVFTLSGGYDFTFSDSSATGDYIRHVLHAQIAGRF